MEKHNVSRLVGAPPGYVGYEEGGQLTERVRRRPYSVVLFDEIEKAHHDVFNMLLQIMEEGRLTDSFGRHVDFRNTIVIMTSNIGSEVVKNQTSLGFSGGGAAQSYEKMKENLQRELERHFRPEFLNRVDDTIVFQPLTRDDLKKIIDIELVSIRARLEERGVSLALTEQAREFIIEEGSNLEFGARPLRRALERLIEDPLSEEILRGAFAEKPHVKVKVKDGHLFFDASAKAPKGSKKKDDDETEESPPPEPRAAASAE
jgi:ATP-dependent Clp protease ATP-binding subunit ClpC